MRLGWPPAIIYKSDRGSYLNALDHADKRDDGSLAELLSRSFVASTYHLLKDIAGPRRRRRSPRWRSTMCAADVRDFVAGLGLPADAAERLIALTPGTYIGIAEKLVDEYLA